MITGKAGCPSCNELQSLQLTAEGVANSHPLAKGAYLNSPPFQLVQPLDKRTGIVVANCDNGKPVTICYQLFAICEKLPRILTKTNRPP